MKVIINANNKPPQAKINDYESLKQKIKTLSDCKGGLTHSELVKIVSSHFKKARVQEINEVLLRLLNDGLKQSKTLFNDYVYTF